MGRCKSPTKDNISSECTYQLTRTKKPTDSNNALRISNLSYPD
ncbi:predicted protein [Botrytis cinerea T4]|uniref:Uncharacterized protein n=1 Tax=Botryotinia fuckeliana (strain T4) TaxID=999810 RepID=G2YQ15_BOTF4|nr:predicted protein [Botrytis cinerea T4]